MTYYTDPNGEKKDLREIDYISILNMVKPTKAIGVDAAQEWNDIFKRPSGVKTNTRRMLVKEISPRGMIFNAGKPIRIQFNDSFLKALKKAMLRGGDSKTHNMRSSKARGRKAIIQARFAIGIKRSKKM